MTTEPQNPCATDDSKPARPFHGCPDWWKLEADRHDISLNDDGHAVIGHDGPTFGRCPYGGETRGETGAVHALEITVADLGHPFASTLSAEALRQISADALAAVEWLETHQ